MKKIMILSIQWLTAITMIVLLVCYTGCANRQADIEKHKTLIRQEFDEAWNKGNTEILDVHIAPDFVRHCPPNPDIVGLNALKEYIKKTPEVFTSFQATIDEIICTGDKSITRFTIRAIPRGQDKEVTMTGSTIDHWKGGKSVERWTHMDYLGFMQRQGYTLTPQKLQ